MKDQAFLPLRHELIVDNFAGGGGASTGIEDAFGRSVDIAINHDPEAVAMHIANHPRTQHYCEDVFTVDPLKVTGGQPVGLAWFSPDCKHFSKAKGGKPVEKKIRGLAWVVVKWARIVKPRVIALENVEEFQKWGPLLADGRPCPAREGLTFRRWLGNLKAAGYHVEMRELRASDYGTPTIRKRLFVIARCDGRPIIWPKPTHGKGLLPYRTAAECIDWSIPCPSIFERERPLAEATLRRIATGIQRYVINAAKPFIVPITHTGGDRVHSIDEGLRTVTTAARGELALCTPFIARTAHGDVDKNGKRRGQGQHELSEPLPTTTGSNDFSLISPTLIQTGYGEREGQAPRTLDLHAPLGTVMGQGQKHALVAAFLAQHNSERGGFSKPGRPADVPLSTIVGSGGQQQVVAAFMEQANTDMVGHDLREPVSTIVGKGANQRLVTSNLVKLKGTCKDGQPVDEPIHTVQAGGNHFAEVRAFLIQYYSNGSGRTGSSIDEPMPTLPTHDRIGLVTIEGTEYAIVDIGMRMLQPHELFAAQGFPRDYIIAPMVNGKPMTKTAQVRCCGNSVCPPVAEALVRANFQHEQKYEAAVA